MQTQSHSDQIAAPPGLEQQLINKPSSQLPDDLIQQYNSNVTSGAPTAASVVAGTNNNNTVNTTNQVQYSVQQPTTAAQHLQRALEMPQLASASLSAEQSQYFNSLTSQNSTSQQPATGAANLVNSYQPVAPVQYASYAEQVAAGQQQVVQQSVGGQRQTTATTNNKQRARVPPPSKIPSSAVEMPDTLNNIGYLDVQFGGLDFGGDDSFDQLTDKFQASTIVDNSQTATDVTADYQTKASVVQPSAALSAAAASLQTSQLISNNDALSNQTDNLSTSAYNQRGATVQPSSQTSLSTASAGELYFKSFFF